MDGWRSDNRNCIKTIILRPKGLYIAQCSKKDLYDKSDEARALPSFIATHPPRDDQSLSLPNQMPPRSFHY